MAKKAPQKPKDLPKGFGIEEALRLYFSGLGYFAIRSLPYRIDGSDVTDVDIWLYERPASLARQRTIVDIKNKKTPQAAERLIWTKGLQGALGVEAAFVATTDRRTATQKLAKALKVGLIEDVPFQKFISEFNSQTLIGSQADFENSIREADSIRKNTEWRTALDIAKASLLNSLGFQSANRCLNLLAQIYTDTVSAPPGSARAQTGMRLAYFISACAAVSLDFALSDSIFRSKDERVTIISNGIRFGSSDGSISLNRIRTASSLADKYLPNGRHLSKVIENAFMADADNIPAEIIAEFIAKQRLVDALFEPARELLDASLSAKPLSFDNLKPQAKALLGVFIDFVGGTREKFAKAIGETENMSRLQPENMLPLDTPEQS